MKKKHKIIYLDHAAATPINKYVAEEMWRVSNEFYGNPSSIHTEGRRSAKIIEDARNSIAKNLSANKNEIIFTGSGTEANNLALLGVAQAYMDVGKHIIVSCIEHPSILSIAKTLEEKGFEITYLPVDKNGLIDVDECIKAVRSDTILISIMYSNNEIGTIEPIAELAERLKNLDSSALLHTDACQAVGALLVQVDTLGVDLMTINGGKIYGPKGIGLLYVKNSVKLKSTIVGGHQEYGKRAGTENTASIHGLSIALELSCKKRKEESNRLSILRDYFFKEIQNKIPEVKINGHKTNRLPNNINISIPYIEGESMLLMLDQYRICSATGSACASNDLSPSHVLLAIGVAKEYIHGSLRFSLGESTTKEDIDYTVTAINNSMEALEKITIPTVQRNFV